MNAKISIKFNSELFETKEKREEYLDKQINKLIYLEGIESIKNKMDLIYGTLELFSFNSVTKKEMLKKILTNNNLLDVSSSIHSASVFKIKNKNNYFNFENFRFIIKYLKKEDLQYQDGSFLIPSEVQYYLFRLTIKMLSSGGSSNLSRNYFIQMKDMYSKFTGRTINKQKIARLNKILEKYKWIHRMSNRIFTFGEDNPLFYSSINQKYNINSVLNTQIEVPASPLLSEFPTLEEEYKALDKNYDNLLKDYSELLELYVNLKAQTETRVKYDKFDLKNAFNSVGSSNGF